MKKTTNILIVVTLSLGVGLFGGWWANSTAFKFLCSKPSAYKLGKDIIGDGIHIKAGKQVNLRLCEYANRFTLELYSEKGNYPELFIPIKSSSSVINRGAEQYSVDFKDE